MTAAEYLASEPVGNADLLEMLRRGTADVLYCTQHALAMHERVSGAAVLCAETEREARAALEHLVNRVMLITLVLSFLAGGLFTLSINYEDLGYAAGEMAVKILKGEAKPEDMPIKHLSSKDLVVVKNDEMAEALGIDLSALDA